MIGYFERNILRFMFQDSYVASTTSSIKQNRGCTKELILTKYIVG